MTARIRADTFSGRCRLKVATANAQIVSISSQSRIEPSWLPQVAAIRYCSGRVLFELVATLRTEKSLRDEARRQADEGERDQHEQQPRRRPRQRHPVGAAARRAEHRHDAEHGGDAEGDPEGEVTELGDHLRSGPPLIDSASLGLPCWARLSASAASGGM